MSLLKKPAAYFIPQPIPAIVKGVVDRVNAVLNDPEALNPIPVYFSFGHYQEITRELYIKDGSATMQSQRFPLIWLVMDFDERLGEALDVYAQVALNIIIACPTKPEFTTQQRYDQTFTPTLYPVYQEFINQVCNEPLFRKPSFANLVHTKIDRPYWGGQDAAGNGVANLFNDYIDAIQIKGIELYVKRKNC